MQIFIKSRYISARQQQAFYLGQCCILLEAGQWTQEWESYGIWIMDRKQYNPFNSPFISRAFQLGSTVSMLPALKFVFGNKNPSKNGFLKSGSIIIK